MNENFKKSVDIDKNSDIFPVETRINHSSLISGLINQIFNKSNILLNTIKNFSTKYNSDDRKILSNKKFLLTFNELIALIKEAIETQIKIYQTDANQIEVLKNLTQEYINNLSYNIFSYEKIEIKQKQKINYIKHPLLKNKTKNVSNYNLTQLSQKKLNNKTIEYYNSNNEMKSKLFGANNIPIKVYKQRAANLVERKSYIKKNEQNQNSKNKNIKINMNKNENKKNINNKSVEIRKNKTSLIETEKTNVNNNDSINYNSNMNIININSSKNNTNKYNHVGVIVNKFGKTFRNENKKNKITRNHLCSSKDLHLSAENINTNEGIIKSSSVAKIKENVIFTEINKENRIMFNNTKKKHKICYENTLFNSKTIIQKQLSDYIVRTPNNLAWRKRQNEIDYAKDKTK